MKFSKGENIWKRKENLEDFKCSYCLRKTDHKFAFTNIFAHVALPKVPTTSFSLFGLPENTCIIDQNPDFQLQNEKNYEKSTSVQ